jgi:opacity protein-like surface antigen
MLQRSTLRWTLLCGLCVSLLAGLLAASELAYADGIPNKGTPGIERPDFLPVPGKDGALKAAPWTGIYAGASAGYSWSGSQFQDFIGDSHSLNADEFLFSPTAGADVQLGNMVAGLQVEGTWSHLRAAWESQSLLASDWQWYVGGRVGVLPMPDLLVYASLGWTWEQGKLTFPAFAQVTSFRDLNGLTYGGGVERMLGNGWSVRADYKHVQYGNETAPVGVIDGLKDGSHINSDADVVRVGIMKRF